MIRSIIKNLTKKKTLLFAGILALGIIFMLIGEYTQAEKKATTGFDEADYTNKLETRLAEMIESVDGVCDVKVMVTLAGSARYQYETGASQSVMAGGAAGEPTLLYRTSNDQSEPVLRVVSAPEIKGVSVVCKGAGNVLLKQKVIGLIAGALDLSVNRIYVTE